MKIDPRLKLAEPGLTTNKTPIKPIPRAAQRRGPTCSPNIKTESKVIISGAEKRIASISAKGKAANPIIKVVYERKSSNPRTYWSLIFSVLGKPRCPS